MKKGYRGPLTSEQLSLGIKSCLENAQSLLMESKLLLGNKNFPRAAYLALSCIEEIAKTQVLFEMAGTPVEKRSNLWNAFYRHDGKVDEIIETTEQFDRLLELGGPDLKERFPTFGKFHSFIREVSLYVDFDGEIWRTPSAQMNNEGASAAIEAASIIFENYKAKGEAGFFKAATLETKREVCISAKSSLEEKKAFIKRLLNDGTIAFENGLEVDGDNLSIILMKLSLDLF